MFLFGSKIFLARAQKFLKTALILGQLTFYAVIPLCRTIDVLDFWLLDSFRNDYRRSTLFYRYLPNKSIGHD